MNGSAERITIAGGTAQSYYGRPILKPPVWSDDIPAYLFTGGLAGASALLAFAARIGGNDVLARRALIGAGIGTVASPYLLIKDLHDPKRFHHMLRVFKPSSPMSMGTWILSAFGGFITLAIASECTGIAPRVGRVCEGLAAFFALGLCTYTAPLIADTAVPIWHGAGETLPFVFIGSAAASAAGFALVATPIAHAGSARRLLVLAAIVELIAVERMHARLGSFLDEPYTKGRAGRLGTASKWMTIASVVVCGALGRKRPAALVAGALALGAAIAQRFSIFRAGVESATDPKYVVIPQRERLAARARTNGDAATRSG